MSNIPSSCWEKDPAAPWNDIEIAYTYRILIKVGSILFASDILKDSVWVSHFTIKSEDDYVYVENDLYVTIEERLSDDIKDLDYQVELLNWRY